MWNLSNRTEPLDKGDLGAALLLVLRDEVDGVESLQGQLVHGAAPVEVGHVAVPARRVASTQRTSRDLGRKGDMSPPLHVG